MKLNYLWVVLLMLVLAGCEKDVDEDGVPKVDLTAHLADVTKRIEKGGSYPTPVRLVTVQGKDIELGEFSKKYCVGKIGNIFRPGNKTCDQVAGIINYDGARQPGSIHIHPY